ncbi:MAG: M12 family metallopeptidase [Deltaproteobacteria bacterium]|nr:M12 family metallopeptidase [Deltaproteobacteria bacterium]
MRRCIPLSTLVLAGCVSGGAAAPGGVVYGPNGPYGSGAPTAPAPVADGPPAEGYRVTQARQHATAFLFLPGAQAQQLVRYSVVDGVAVMDGDIMLGPAAQLPVRYGVPWGAARNVRSAVAMRDRSHLWPGSQIPYEIAPGTSATLTRFIQGAALHVSTTSLKLRPRAATDNDYVVFRDNGTGCSSYLGRVGGRQEINVTEGCGQGGVVHEILHAAGFYHEQSRGDRDEYVTIAFNEISPGHEDNFEKRDSRGVEIGPYDFASIMHYSSRAFSRSGRPTIIPKVPGVTIGQREALSNLDRAAIEELYASTQPPPPSPAPPSPAPPAPGPTPPAPTPPAPSVDNGSYAGTYASNRGNVSCSQNGAAVSCQYPGGVLICAANGPALECGWSGGGQGRAAFQRQANGVLAGTYGDLFSNNSRGAWTLTPLPPGGAPPPAPAPPAPAPGPAPAAPAAIAGNYQTTRGPMACTESGTIITCGFQETPTLTSRMDCTKDAAQLTLTCTWITFLPPGSGRARFSRASVADRNWSGTFGHFMADTGGGTWDLRGQ